MRDTLFCGFAKPFSGSGIIKTSFIAIAQSVLCLSLSSLRCRLYLRQIRELLLGKSGQHEQQEGGNSCQP